MAAVVEQGPQIQIGSDFPDVSLTLVTSKVDDKKAPDGACANIQRDFTTVKSKDYFANKKIVLFSVPGAFTPTCSERHLPSFLENFDALKSKGVDEIICMAVNDRFVMRAWSQAFDTSGKLVMLSDSLAEVAKALGLAFNAGPMGIRSRRFAMLLDNNRVKALRVDGPGEFKVTGADNIMSAL